MLKINKILSKKIKFPLSLRGSFPFCHSRESGTPSSLSLREAKQACPSESRGSNLSGFSLIELMVAVAILAIAIFGIFQAYSVGFMGMADARDRTVATNYAREAMEDVKNMDFELITNSNIGTTVLIEGKYYRSVTIIDLSLNLKRIITRVYWKNRKDETVDVTTETIVNYIQFYAGEASKIVLYAKPYATLLPSEGGNEIEITAIIKDKQGNTKTDWKGGDIVFSISEGENLAEIKEGSTTNTTKGIARTTLRETGAKEDDGVTFKEGTVIIQASINEGAISNSINIIVALGVTRIDLTVNPDSIPADGSKQSTITALLKDAYGDIVETATNDITFSITGPGLFVGYDSDIVTLSTLNSNGVPTGKATIDIISIFGNPGLITITASSEGLFNGNINVVSYGDPTSISVIASTPGSRNFIYDDGIDIAIIKVTILDQNSNPIPYSGVIDLYATYATDDEGTTVEPGFAENPLSFVDEHFRFTDFTCSKAGVINISAIGTYNGNPLNMGNTTVIVELLLVPDSISLTAVPPNLPAGSVDSSTITATVKSNSTIVATYDKDITFSLTTDTSAYLSYNGNTEEPLILEGIDYGSDGVAEIDLFPGNNVGTRTAIISVSIAANPLGGEPITDEITVSFYLLATKIDLMSSPPNIQVNSDCTLTAFVKDNNNITVSDYNENITFTIVEGNPLQIKFFATSSKNLTLIKPFKEGKVSILLKSQNKAGTAIIEASSLDIFGSINIPVGISLILVSDDDSPKYVSSEFENSVSFKIDVKGAALLLEEMQVSWDPSNDETLNKIKIEETIIYNDDTDDSVGSIEYPDDFNIRIADVNVSDITLPTETYTIIMYFDTDMIGKNILDVTFNTNSGDYLVDLTL